MDRRAVAGICARIALAILIAGATALASRMAVAADANKLEYTVKATYLYKFAAYVTWPAGAFASPSIPVTLCVVGDDPFGDVLDRAVKGQHIGDRPITIRRVQAAAANLGCHVMYVAGSTAQPVAQALAAVRGTPVLTVTNSAHGDKDFGIVNFVVKDNRVRFQIDAGAASQNGLIISSDLLKLALSVTAGR